MVSPVLSPIIYPSCPCGKEMPASLSHCTGYKGGYWKIRNVRQEVQPLHCWTQSPYFLQSPHLPIQTYGPLLQCRSLSASSVSDEAGMYGEVPITNFLP